LFAVSRLDQDQTGRIETERAQAVTMKPAVALLPIGWDDEEQWMNS
jgi:hypothetical protein